MAEPKKRTNSSKQGMRRMHDKVAMPSIGYCSNCKEAVKLHTVCSACGYYDGKPVIEQKKSKESAETEEK